MIERIFRVAASFAEAEALDRADIAALSLEDRVSAVERLRREIWGAGRVELAFEARPLFVIGRAALIANKRAAGRPKDLLDAALLEHHAPPRRAPGSRAARKRRPPRLR